MATMTHELPLASVRQHAKIIFSAMCVVNEICCFKSIEIVIVIAIVLVKEWSCNIHCSSGENPNMNTFKT